MLPPDPTPIPRPAPPPKAAAVRAPEPREEVEEQVVALNKPPVRVRGFLSIETNIPAKVFLDGDLISRSTPVRRYPVRVGSYEVMMIALSTGEMKKMSVRILKGKENQVTVLNFSVPPRR
ncbi:hypothetical protein HR086_34055 [Myxococcus sp. CA039A]|nr:hypothetical protein [Myxococcus sp. CA039A]